MITAASILFMLVFVALGARPYRVAEPLPPCDAVLPMPAIIYTGNFTQDDYSEGNAFATRREPDQYSQERGNLLGGNRVLELKRRIKSSADKLKEIRKARCGTAFSRCLDAIGEDLKHQVEQMTRETAARARQQSYFTGHGTWRSSGNKALLAYSPSEKTFPPCFICHNTLSKPYPDRDYYCDHCKSFISLNTAR